MTRTVYQIEGQTLRMIRDHAARVIGYEQMASGASFAAAVQAVAAAAGIRPGEAIGVDAHGATAEAIRIAEIVDDLLKQPTVEVED